MNEDEAEALGWDLVLEEEEVIKHAVTQAEALLDECEETIEHLYDALRDENYEASCYEYVIQLLTKLKQRKERG